MPNDSSTVTHKAKNFFYQFIPLFLPNPLFISPTYQQKDQILYNRLHTEWKYYDK